MAGLRDYEQWHAQYDDPGSDLSWRLHTGQRFVRQALDRHRGRIRVLSSCAGDGRDVLGVLAHREDAARVGVTLLENHPRIADRARAAAAGLAARVEVRTVDAGDTDAYRGAVPAELVLMVGILGNVGAADLRRTIAATPQFCVPGATLLWSRGLSPGRSNDALRAAFAAAGSTELEYRTLDGESPPAVGAVRYDGPPVPLVTGQRLFTFVR